MTASKLKVLLLLPAIIGTTLCLNAQDSNKVILKFPQFDFYAQAVVDRNLLRADTTNLNFQLRACEEVNQNLTDELKENNMIITQKDNEIKADTVAFKDVSKKYNKEQKKVKALKQTTLVFLLTTLILAVIVILK